MKAIRNLRVLALTGVFSLLLAGIALASDADASFADTNTTEHSVDIDAGKSADVDVIVTVTGNQAGTATFKIYTDYTLVDDDFERDEEEYEQETVAPRAPQDAANEFDFTVHISVDEDQVCGEFKMTIAAEDITNTNQTGAKLDDGEAATLTVVVPCNEEENGPQYHFFGFYEPVKSNDPQIANKVRAGQGVALKWNLYLGDPEKDNEITVLDGYALKSFGVECPTGAGAATVTDDPAVAAGSSDLRYDEIDGLDDAYGQTIFVWKTNRNWASSCREFVVSYDGEEVHRALFEFTR